MESNDTGNYARTIFNSFGTVGLVCLGEPASKTDHGGYGCFHNSSASMCEAVASMKENGLALELLQILISLLASGDAEEKEDVILAAPLEGRLVVVAVNPEEVLGNFICRKVTIYTC